jgi:dihydrofolate reductase
MIRLIAAADRKSGVAKHGILPWYIPADEKYFTEQTKLFGGNVLTGGRTFRETYHGPLTGRQNFILTRETEPIEGVSVVNDLLEFLKSFKNDLWVAGGAAVFKQVIDAGYADELYLTHIDADFNCDQFFPAYQDSFKLAEQAESIEQNGFNFAYARYVKKSN